MMADQWGMEPWMYSPNVQFNEYGQMVAPTAAPVAPAPVAAAPVAAAPVNITPQDIADFQALMATYGQPAGRDWYSHEISNIAQAFANSKGQGGNPTYVGSLAGNAFPNKTFNQAPASEFAEGQDNGDSMFDGVGGLLALAGLGFGGYSLLSGLGGAAAGGALGEGALASTLAAEGSSGLLGAGAATGAGAAGAAALGDGSLASILAAEGSSGLLPAAGAGAGTTAAGMSAADAIAQAAAAGSEFGVTSAAGPLANGWQGALANALSGIPNIPPGVSSAIKALGGGGGAAAGAAGALGRVLDGSATSADWLSLAGKAGGGILDYMQTSGAADNAKEIADRTWGAGQQYRDNASRAMTPGFDLNSMPGYSGALSTGMDAFNRSLSAKNGNPWGQGGAAGEAISWAGKTIGLPAWQNYFNSNSNAGGLSNLATQSTGAAMNAGAADAATYGSLGQTARNIFDPQPNYQKQYLDLLGKQYGLA